MQDHSPSRALTPPHEPLAAAEVAIDRTVSRRLVASAVALASGAILVVAAILDPSPTGLGTHEQLALPACGWIALADIPCPTCGMTTAFAHAANGEFLASAGAQPAGFLLALAVAVAFSGAVYVVATGARLGWALDRLACARVGWISLLVLIGAWVYKVLSHKGLV